MSTEVTTVVQLVALDKEDPTTLKTQEDLGPAKNTAHQYVVNMTTSVHATISTEKENIDKAKENVTANIDKARENVTANIDKAKENVTANFDKAKENVTANIDKAKENVAANIDKAKEAYTANITKAMETAKGGADLVKGTTTTYVQNVNTAMNTKHMQEEIEKAKGRALEIVSLDGKLTEEQTKALANAKTVAVTVTNYIGSTFFDEDNDDEKYGHRQNETGKEHYGARFRLQLISLEETLEFGTSVVYEFRDKFENYMDVANNASLGYGARYKLARMYPLAIKVQGTLLAQTDEEDSSSVKSHADTFLKEFDIDVHSEFRGEHLIIALKKIKLAGHHVQFYKTKSVSFTAYVITITGQEGDPDEKKFLEWMAERWQEKFEKDLDREHVHKFLRIAAHLVLGI